MMINERCVMDCWFVSRDARGHTSYLFAAEPAVSWSRCPAGLQPGSWADCQCCWPPAGGSAGSEGADTMLGINVEQIYVMLR